MKCRVNIQIVVKDFVLETIALFDTGADSNCIKEGLVPTKYFEKTTERLSPITGERLKINFKLTNTFVEKGNLRISTNFIIAKDIKNDVVLGTPFIIFLFPYLADFPGITSYVGGQETFFEFLDSPTQKALNQIESKTKQIYFLKEEISFKTLESQLSQPRSELITNRPKKSCKK
ncbi:hypothetical protein HN873_044298, partial [Arachis hypogaea]